MSFTADYLKQAENLIKQIFLSKRQAILDAHGNIEAEVKDDKTIVTKLDFEMEKELKKALRGLDAGVGFLGEELGQEGSEDTFWVVDPIDGTESFVRGLPVFRNQAALIDHGQPVYSIAYRPVTDEFFIARKGKGTYRNGQKLQFSQRPIERVRLEVWAKFADPGIATILPAIEGKIENIRFTDEYLYVVEGKLDVHLAWRPKSVKLWDHAPRALLLAEAGAKLANIGSDHYDINDGKWLAANPEIFDELMALIVNNIEKS